MTLELTAIRTHSDVFEAVAVINESLGNFTGPDDMETVTAASMSDNFLDTLGMPPALGRFGVAAGHWTVGHRRRHQLRAVAAALPRRPRSSGSRIEVNNLPMTVAGVLPRRLQNRISGRRSRSRRGSTSVYPRGRRLRSRPGRSQTGDRAAEARRARCRRRGPTIDALDNGVIAGNIGRLSGPALVRLQLSGSLGPRGRTAMSSQRFGADRRPSRSCCSWRAPT